MLEILVVIVIIGIILSFASLSIGRSTDRVVQEESQRLAGLITLAAQEAVLQSREMALQFTPGGYEFVVFDKDQWRRISGDDTLRERRLPEGVRLDINVEGEAVALGKADAEKPASQPRIYLLSSGEVTPFQITLQSKANGSSYQLKGDVGGRVEMSETGNAAKR
ncbi:MAG: type II secretion system minor pseudopilin GspH [Gammaproteobacteria bacterium]|nr:type II secretion system minor pseudopilin GspH [Gammaproteobacteria bacterium]